MVVISGADAVGGVLGALGGGFLERVFRGFQCEYWVWGSKLR